MVANSNTPFGLQPIRRIDGAVWNDSLTEYYIPATDTNAFYVGDAVVKVAGSADAAGVNGVTIANAAGPITGVICGFRPAYGRTPGPSYRPASGGGVAWYALVNDDPEAAFLIQENDDLGGTPGTPLAVADVGKNANLILAAGSIYTGWSGAMLDANTVATTSTLALNIKSFEHAPNNTPGALYAKVIVTINNHTETPHQAGI
jgi:hypothetical protein